MTDSVTVKNRSLVAAVVAGITASACCAGPLVLLTLGVSGAWISNLTALEPYRPVFIGVTLVFLGLTFRRLYLVPQVCKPGKPCAVTGTLRKHRAVFWTVSAILLALVAFPWYGPWFLN